MNNGHTKTNGQVNGIFSGSSQYQPSVGNPYFTAGDGKTPAGAIAQPEQNLNEENWQHGPQPPETPQLPGVPESPEPPHSPEAPEPPHSPEIPQFPEISQNPQTPELPKNPYELGQITPISPINPNQPAAAPTPIPSENAQNYNINNIRTTGDHLEKSAIPEVDNIISELNQTGNLNNFYDEIRGTDEKPGMVQANLKNSFNRVLGQDQSGGGK